MVLWRVVTEGTIEQELHEAVEEPVAKRRRGK